jgi:hypothetical protein
MSISSLRDVMVVQDQTKHTAVGGVSSGHGLLGRAGCFLGRHGWMEIRLVQGREEADETLDERRDEVREE